MEKVERSVTLIMLTALRLLVLNQPPYHPMKAPPTTSPKKQIPSSQAAAGCPGGRCDQ